MQGGMPGGMEGGMFGPMGGPQNFGGRGQMTDRELRMLLSQIGGGASRGAVGGTLPMYDTPAPAGGPASPQGVPGLGTTGIDPNMIAQVGAAGGGLEGMDFGAQGDQMGGMQDAIMNMGRQKAEEERIRELLAAAGGGGNVPVRPATAGWLANPTSGHGMGAPSSYPSGFGNSARQPF